MKYITTALFLLFALSAFGQAYEIEAVTDSTLALKVTTYGQDSLANVEYLTGELDSAAFESRLLGFVFEYRNAQATRLRQNKDKENAAKDVNSLISTLNYSDTTYFKFAQNMYANRYTADGALPNFRIRVGSNFYWGIVYIAGNDLLRLELTDSSGAFLSPRDNATMYLYGLYSFRVLASLDILGENVDFTLMNDTGTRKVWEGTKADGTLIRINQWMNR